ncbi:MbnP family copper-binding protein [Hyalangium rubrum]|uniref:Metallo-mystery pair system four-Cys motif protein n=1 Tax=Hyalangium rubrum TaxID=3103134 RepID=A0ABU5HAK4_9BACT|nr:MbnP family copper-binding protein [Hyalangium sp. s54d21]MDY7230340.1 metallo-mystery pair system four-Cys motif protein [Hyalangium sp. s54d21]
MVLLSARLTFLLPLVVLCATGCGDEEPTLPEPPPPPTDISIPFEARVGDKPFACGQSYPGLGATGTTYEPMDFRMYLHDVRLVSDTGQEVPVTLTNDGEWQVDGAAFLDFEDKTGLCTNGTKKIRTQVVGTVPAGNYRGLRFRVGLPSALNHQDVSTAPTPLNDPTLFWGWRTGYLFLRVDGRTTGLKAGHFMHLGSTDCAGPPPGQTTGSAGCTFPNRPEISLDGFELDKSKVVLDLATLFTNANLDTNAEVTNTSIGCMSQKEDPDCTPMFHQLGLSMDTSAPPPASQSFIRVE